MKPKYFIVIYQKTKEKTGAAEKRKDKVSNKLKLHD